MPAGLYVHVPLCVSKCPYCDFFSVVAPERSPQVLMDLEAEADLVAAAFGPFDSIYIGGGTPSSLPPDLLARLLASARRIAGQARGNGDLEFTVELNPADVDDALLEILAGAGVSRISLGVQSFDDGELSWLGRRHDPASAERAIASIRAAGFAGLGLDLLQGLPGQTGERFGRSLDRALESAPEHLSCYCLTVADKTPLGAQVARAEVRLPGEDELADLFLQTSQALTRAGYEHYEVSNFARTPGLRSRHNQKYWAREPVLGLGPGAHSFDGRCRWWNHADLDEYHEALQAGLRPAAGLEELTDEQMRLERLALGLRTADGVAMEAVGSGREAQLARIVADGLARIAGGRLRPSLRGMLVADGLARQLA